MPPRHCWHCHAWQVGARCRSAKESQGTTHRPACRKLQDKGGQVSDVRNIAQLLVVIHLPEDHNAMLFGSAVQYCYHVMGLVHAKWAPIPGAIKVGSGQCSGRHIGH